MGFMIFLYAGGSKLDFFNSTVFSQEMCDDDTWMLHYNSTHDPGEVSIILQTPSDWVGNIIKT